MPIWILLAIAAQFFNAIVSLIDKYIVSSKHILPQPFVYAFYICILSGGAIVVYALGVIPMPIDGVSFPSLHNVHLPTLGVVGLSVLAGYVFFCALVSMFRALKQGDASDVVPVVGAITAIGSYGLAYLFLGAKLSPNFLLGVIVLAIGTLLASHLRFSWGRILTCVCAGVFFALYYVVLKGLFNITSFDNGFFWSRMAIMLCTLSLLVVPMYRHRIFVHTNAAKKRTSVFILFNKIIAGVASILILKATQLGDVSVVQALGGLQFVFIFLLGITTVGPYAPSTCGEQGCTPRVLLHKTLFIAIISLGFFVLFI